MDSNASILTLEDNYIKHVVLDEGAKLIYNKNVTSHKYAGNFKNIKYTIY